MNKPIAREEFEGTLHEGVPDDGRLTRKRKIAFLLLALAVLLGGILWFGYSWLTGGGVIETDTAYVGAETAQITPLVAGQVAQVLASDAQEVQAGQPLVVLDQTDARIAVAEAEAELNQAQRRVTGMIATDRQLAAQISGRDAEARAASARTVAAQSEVQRTTLEYNRRSALGDSGAVSGEELSTSRAQLEQARSALDAARAAQAQASAGRAAASGQRESNQAMIRGASVNDNPEVLPAQARLQRARLELERTIIRAPVSGIVARRQVQVGQRVQPGAPLMSVVPIQQAFVDPRRVNVEMGVIPHRMPLLTFWSHSVSLPPKRRRRRFRPTARQ